MTLSAVSVDQIPEVKSSIAIAKAAFKRVTPFHQQT
jgi:hypothetical protein